MQITKINPILPLLIALAFMEPLYAQEQPKDSIELAFRPYTSLRGHTAIYSNKMELQENASRMGAEIRIKKGTIVFIAGVEVQVNLFRGNTSFSADGGLTGGYQNLQSVQTKQVFGNRLGYLGLDMNKFGTLTIGKQWSVYRDITAYTDRFSVFGARASATFIGGTDGGENGTGRADQSIIYRNQIGSFRFGGQIQARGQNNTSFVDGFGIAAQLEITSDWFIGAAFNKAYVSENLINSGTIVGLNGQPIYMAIGSKYIGKKMDFSIVGVLQKNGDFTQGNYTDLQENTITPTIVFDARGLEIFGKYKWSKLAILAGYNYYAPITSHIPLLDGQLPIEKGFKRNDFIAGITYQPIPFVQLYSEQRISTGSIATGTRENSVFTLGMKIDLATDFKKNVGL